MRDAHLWDVALLSPPYTTLTYVQPGDFPDWTWHPGQRVFVPVRREIRLGLLLDRVELGNKPGQKKALLWPRERRPLFPPSFLRLLQALSLRYVSSPGRIVATILPGQVKSAGGTLVSPEDDKISLSQLAALSDQERRSWVEKWLTGDLQFLSSNRAGPSQMWDVACHPPWPLRPQAFRQMHVLDFLWAQGPQNRQELTRNLGDWASRALKELADKGLAVARDPGQTKRNVSAEPCGELSLSRDQEKVLAGLEGDLKTERACTRLLFGVTGSGKTLVYARLARKCLQGGRSVLLLVPEVALALQIHAQVMSLVPEADLILYHGSMPPAQRTATYIQSGGSENPALVVGTRSAVFLPRSDWGLIILDEEHDASFKQEERLAYQAKEVAYFLSQDRRALLVLGSATPDVKTFFAAQNGQVGLFTMPTRISGRTLPEIELVNLLQEPEEDGPFSPRCRQALHECLENGEQAIILLNRRGYAPLVYCTSCAQVVRCDHCAVGLTYHKKMHRLVCHYCGHTRPFPSPCRHCGGYQYVPLNQGTEQVEEYLRTRLDPDISTLRLDRDSTRPQGSMEDILERFAKGQAQVLVGTQMCSKGHNFPQVTLVIVVDGDVGLNLPDYRATERTFQLLVQVAGRAGRGERPGRVYIQTRNPEHYCWQFVQSYDFEGFYTHEISLRRRMHYPPFVKLALVRMSAPADSEKDLQRLQDLGRTLRQDGSKYGVQVLGPAPAPLSQLRGRIRFQCLLKADSWTAIRSAYARFLSVAKDRGGCRIQLDLDPMQML
ncbi:MAG: primosomal protein N' [Desulfovermiculus sp.]|nr:primosomal protein N' [Desulfovermiculus sp.]